MRLVRRETDVLSRQRELLFAVYTLDLVPEQYVHPAAVQKPRQVQRDRHVLPKLLLPVRVAHEPPVAARHVPGVEVEERHPQAGVLYGFLDLAEVLTGRPPELDGPEPGRRSKLETLQKRSLFEEY